MSQIIQNQSFFDELIEWIKANKPSKSAIHHKKLELCKLRSIRDIPTDIEIYMHANKDDLKIIRTFLQTKPIRTSAGVAVIATMSMPSLCPHGACTFCPGGLGSPYGDVPMSYTGTEPSTMRGIRNEFDPYRIIFNRLEQYIILGQHPDKCDQIIMGGTFPSFPKDYQKQYAIFSFKAYNDFSKLFFKDGELQLDIFKEFFELPNKVGDKDRQERIKKRILEIKYQNPKSLEEEQVENETAVIRCIGMTIETKPDWGFAEHALEFLELGATRVELGVQTIYDDILQAVNRGHTLADTKKSIQELRDLAFKINFHIMPGLPTPQGERIDRTRDIASIKAMFDDPAFRPDMIKIYPCMVMPGTPLEQQWKKGLFTPLTTMEAADIIVEAYRFIPEYCRIMRVQRDIPTYSTTSGVDKTNLRQYVDDLAKERGVVCRDIRSREPRGRVISGDIKLITREFEAAGGTEFFISAETPDTLLGFVRMRYPSKVLHPAITIDSALIRELHVYGQAVAIGTKDEKKVQHKGLGKQLMAEAEKIATVNKKNKIVVISGVGVRDYYRKIGYVREGPYMTKAI